MFTGIVTALGEIATLERREGLLRALIDSAYEGESVAIGASIAHDGVCLTVVEKITGPLGLRHTVEIAAESLAKTTLARWKPGDRVNLERPLRVGDELGGHIVAGHVDGVGEVLSVCPDGQGVRFRIRPPDELAALIARKGSIAVDGVSLTVNEVDAEGFGVLVIPHTLAATTLGALKTGDKVNLEADLFARYVQRIVEARR